MKYPANGDGFGQNRCILRTWWSPTLPDPDLPLKTHTCVARLHTYFTGIFGFLHLWNRFQLHMKATVGIYRMLRQCERAALGGGIR